MCPGHKICVHNKCCACGQTGKRLCRQQCARNNVSSFARALTTRRTVVLGTCCISSDSKERIYFCTETFLSIFGMMTSVLFRCRKRVWFWNELWKNESSIKEFLKNGFRVVTGITSEIIWSEKFYFYQGKVKRMIKIWNEWYLCYYYFLPLNVQLIKRGYHTASRRFEFYFGVVKTTFYEQAQRVKYCFKLRRGNKIHIFTDTV